MTRRVVRIGVTLFFILFLLAVTWPGYLPFNRIHPLVLGMPLSMAWVAGWLSLSFFALVLLDRTEPTDELERREPADDELPAGTSPPDPDSTDGGSEPDAGPGGEEG